MKKIVEVNKIQIHDKKKNGKEIQNEAKVSVHKTEQNNSTALESNEIFFDANQDNQIRNADIQQNLKQIITDINLKKGQIAKVFQEELFISRSELLTNGPASVIEAFSSKSVDLSISKSNQSYPTQNIVKDNVQLDKVKNAIKKLSSPTENEKHSSKDIFPVPLITNDKSIPNSIWIKPKHPDEIKKEWKQWRSEQQSAIIVLDEKSLKDSRSNTYFDPNRRLFKNNHCTFYLGKFANQIALVKNITMDKKNFDVDVTWMDIAQRITKPETLGEFPPNSFNSFVRIYELFYVCTSGELYIFMEPYYNKTLHYHIKHRRPFQINLNIRKWSHQLLNGICYLQNKAIVHRSLRLEHLVLNQMDNLKIISWRRAVPFWRDDNSNHANDYQLNLIGKRESKIRQNNHLPPEAFHNNYDPRYIDLWSFGVILCALTTYRYPFKVMNKKIFNQVETVWQQFKHEHEKLFTQRQDVIDLLDKIFLQNPQHRANILQMQQSKFFNQ